MIKSEFIVGDFVLFWDMTSERISKGEVKQIICSISASVQTTNYVIGSVDAYGRSYTVNIPSGLVFKDRDAVFDFCFKITEGL